MSLEFFNNLVRVCSEKGMTVTGACKKAGLSTSSKSVWSEGRDPRPSSVHRLARVLGVEPAELLYGPSSKESEKEKEPARRNVEGLDRSIPEMLASLTEDDWTAVYYFICGLVSNRHESTESNKD